MKAQGSNENTTKTRILKRESEQFYSRQTIPHEPFDENSYSLQTNVAENIDVPQVTVAENIGAEESFNPQLESMQLYSRQTIPHELFDRNRESLQTNVAGNIDVPQVTVAENIYVSESSVPVETISNSQRESEHFYSRQAIPQEIEENRDSLQTNVAGNIVSQVTVAENIDAEKSSDTVETISNLQQEAFEKGLQIPSYVKTRDANEDISYEKLEKLLSILNQQLNDESSNVETTTGFRL
ncbi:hypothetical protein JTE90_002796 [Oedothorax gibbosus]|uniref:Uncharacterized protein n=1 Tax=Oedothorax gibbosus TaxID=931172 RepID=A0AAV6TGV5_9ARAC|nr:hypothetical protein JTE90_002796 [Oedothorax gibbosus]